MTTVPKVVLFVDQIGSDQAAAKPLLTAASLRFAKKGSVLMSNTVTGLPWRGAVPQLSSQGGTFKPSRALLRGPGTLGPATSRNCISLSSNMRTAETAPGDSPSI